MGHFKSISLKAVVLYYCSFVSLRFKYAIDDKDLDLFPKILCESRKKYIHTIYRLHVTLLTYVS